MVNDGLKKNSGHNQPGLYLYGYIMSNILAGWFISWNIHPSIYIYVYIYIYISGWWLSPTPLKNDGVRQLG